MKAVILAGGEGTRLKPLTSRTPKPLMPVAGRPCIDFVIRSLIASGFREIVITTAYMSDTLIQSIGDGLDSGASALSSVEGRPAGSGESFSDLANAVIYVIEPEVLEFIPPDQKFDFAKDVFPKLLAKGLPVYGKELEGRGMDSGGPQAR